MDYIVKINERTKLGKAVKKFLLSIMGEEVTVTPIEKNSIKISTVKDDELAKEMEKVKNEGFVSKQKILEALK